MKRQEFMDLSSKQQLAWIERNVDEYEVLLYNDGYIGCSYLWEEVILRNKIWMFGLGTMVFNLI